MMMKFNALLIFFLFAVSNSWAQFSNYDFQREINNTGDGYHRIDLPPEIFQNVEENLSDLRVYGITETNDTIEAPYILKVEKDQSRRKNMPFKLINQSKKNGQSYYTYELDDVDVVNEIDLSIAEDNFDWRCNLKGSQNQQEWFTIVEDYRIASIKNEVVDFSFTKLRIPPSKYKYLQLHIQHNVESSVQASIQQLHHTAVNYLEYPITSLSITENEKKKASIIHVGFTGKVPVSQIDISVKDTFDYYRPMLIEVLKDSFNTDHGWKYTYSQPIRTTLNSFNENLFSVNELFTNKLRLTILNYDNEPLNIGEISVKGYQYYLISRLKEKSRFFLVYGNNSASMPNYDIKHFQQEFPEVIPVAQLGEESAIVQGDVPEDQTIFADKKWLWAIMILIILLLGWFTLKMLKSDG